MADVMETFWKSYCKADCFERRKMVETMLRPLIATINSDLKPETKNYSLVSTVQSYFDDCIQVITNE